MSLEQISLQGAQQEKNMTPEVFKSLEIGYGKEIENLRDKNLRYLKKADKIKVVDDRKKIIMRLGWISVKAADVNEELRRSLN